MAAGAARGAVHWRWRDAAMHLRAGSLLCLAAAAHAWPGSVDAEALDPKSLHTVFCAECTTYFDWKSAGVFYSHRLC